MILFFLLLFPHLCVTSDPNIYTYNGKNNNVYTNTGICTCFNGAQYRVGDLSKTCGTGDGTTLACYGDGAIASDCKRMDQDGYSTIGMGMKVTCDNKRYYNMTWDDHVKTGRRNNEFSCPDTDVIRTRINCQNAVNILRLPTSNGNAQSDWVVNQHHVCPGGKAYIKDNKPTSSGAIPGCIAQERGGTASIHVNEGTNVNYPPQNGTCGTNKDKEVLGQAGNTGGQPMCVEGSSTCTIYCVKTASLDLCETGHDRRIGATSKERCLAGENCVYNYDADHCSTKTATSTAAPSPSSSSSSPSLSPLPPLPPLSPLSPPPSAVDDGPNGDGDGSGDGDDSKTSDAPTELTNDLGTRIILNQPSCPKNTYSSYGICIGCESNISSMSSSNNNKSSNTTTSSSSSSTSSIHDVRIQTAIALVSILLSIFCCIILGVWCATKKQNETYTISHVIYRAREFMIFFILSLQTCAYVGPVARVAGGDAITDPHRIIFGVYSSLTFDIRSIAPPACSTNNKGTGLHEPAYFHWFILSITLCIWIPTLIIILYLSKYPTPTENHSSSHCHTCTTALQSNCCQSIISKLLTLLSVIYGFATLLVVEVLNTTTIKYSMSLIIFCCFVVIIFVIGYPLITFIILLTMTNDHKKKMMYIKLFLNYCKPSYWYVRHIHFIFLLFLAIDKGTMSHQKNKIHQLISTFLGIIPGIIYIYFLLYIKPYLHSSRWMMWTRVTILFQVLFGYIVKIVGCLCYWPKYTLVSVLTKNRPIVVVLAYIWLVNYFLSFIVLIVGFFICMLSPREKEMEMDSVLHGGNVEMMNSSSNSSCEGGGGGGDGDDGDGMDEFEYQYEKPAGFKSITEPSRHNRKKMESITYMDEVSGYEYKEDKITGETIWLDTLDMNEEEVEEVEEVHDEAAMIHDVEIATETDNNNEVLRLHHVQLPPTMHSKRKTVQMSGYGSEGWVKTYDDAGNEFFYNASTSETRWDMPNYAHTTDAAASHSHNKAAPSRHSWIEMIRSDLDGTRVLYVHSGTHEECDHLPENWVQNVKNRSIFNHSTEGSSSTEYGYG